MNTKKINRYIEDGFEYIRTLQHNDYQFYPSNDGLTQAGRELQLGFSCYGLKYYYMSGNWSKLSEDIRTGWIDYINSFQTSHSYFPGNSFIDNNYLKYLNNFEIQKFSKNFIKKLINLSGLKKLDTLKDYEIKSINAETKQALSTLYQVGLKNKKTIQPQFESDHELIHYLENLDWTKPWSSGAQFSSFCVYSSTQGMYNPEALISFSNKIVDRNSGFYYSKKPNSTREMFNGAMKMISGFDWIGSEIHYPKKIIDTCLSNQPIFEGCDFVDYVYVLNKCSKQTNYKSNEIKNKLIEISKNMESLFHYKFGGYSYFKSKSQTHYYGVNITSGRNVPDIHGTLLCNWGNILILETLGELSDKYKVIKP